MANLSMERRLRMLSFLEILRKNNQDDVSSLRAINEIEHALNEKEYGLVWEEHTEIVDELVKKNILIFNEIHSKKIVANNCDKFNFLLEGDNLHSLKLLEKTHRGRIDFIYIDPPYNTRKEGFTYDDVIVNENDGFRHSKWLSFMNRRLRCAKRLLSKEGIIFISIDENEYAPAKMLCDEVFGEKNFVENIIWNKRVPKNDKGIGNIHEYILCYVNNSDYQYKIMIPKEGLDTIYEYIEAAKNNEVPLSEANKGLKKLYRVNKYPRAITLYNNLDNEYRVFGKINMSWPNGNTFGERYDVLHPITGNPVKVPDRGWRWSKETFMAAVDYDNIQELHDGSYLCGKIWFSQKDNMQPSSINYLDEVDRMLLRSIISLKSDGGIVLENILGNKSQFSYPKPVTLIKMLIDACTYNKKNAVILDFFAGSGTTGQAVVELNLEDNGNRKYILATNNENNICEEVTYQRLLRIQDKLPHNLKYFKTGLIEKLDNMSLMEPLLDTNKPLVELEYACDIDNSTMKIFLTEDEFDEFVDTVEVIKLTKVFLASDIMVSASQQEKLNNSHCEVIRIPEYYYRSELIESGDL